MAPIKSVLIGVLASLAAAATAYWAPVVFRSTPPSSMAAPGGTGKYVRSRQASCSVRWAALPPGRTVTGSSHIGACDTTYLAA
jgi:hypothetical protein